MFKFSKYYAYALMSKCVGQNLRFRLRRSFGGQAAQNDKICLLEPLLLRQLDLYLFQ